MPQVDNNQSTYKGRKIRIEYHERLQKPSSFTVGGTKKGLITFGEAVSEKIIKPGMVVLFKECACEKIKLNHEMTGKQQQISCEFDKGVVVRNKDGKIAVFSVLRLTSKEGLILKGRYGRANAVNTINDIVKMASKKLEECDMHFLTIQEFVDFCNENYLVTSYLDDKTHGVSNVLFFQEERLIQIKSDTLEINTVKIEPGIVEHKFYNIAISIEGDNIQCNIRNGLAKEITHLHSYQENPHSKYVEIGGS